MAGMTQECVKKAMGNLGGEYYPVYMRCTCWDCESRVVERDRASIPMGFYPLGLKFPSELSCFVH